MNIIELLKFKNLADVQKGKLYKPSTKLQELVKSFSSSPKPEPPPLSSTTPKNKPSYKVLFYIIRYCRDSQLTVIKFVVLFLTELLHLIGVAEFQIIQDFSDY